MLTGATFISTTYSTILGTIRGVLSAVRITSSVSTIEALSITRLPARPF
jgi:hypothetical protein